MVAGKRATHSKLRTATSRLTPRCRPALELFADLTSRHPSDRYIQKPAPEEQTTNSTLGTPECLADLQLWSLQLQLNE